MDNETYTSLTGITPNSAFDFDSVAEAAQAKLESMLGYPLDPGDWDNQYLEIGKTRNECACPNVDALDELDDPDEVVGSYRLYTWRPSDKYLSVDPALTINAVKLVKDGVTYRTFDVDEYSPKWVNGSPAFTKYIAQAERWADLFCICGCGHFDNNHLYQLAVDAEWGFEEVPTELNSVLVGIMSDIFDAKANIRSETITSHSYTKFDKQPIEATFASILSKYAGPNGNRPSLV